MRVLLTDDNPDLIRMLIAMLSDNVEVVPFHMARQALLWPETWENIDAALIDLMMPDVSGLQVMKYLQENFPNIRRVVFTAIGIVPEEVEELADVVLRKPANARTIILALRSGPSNE